MEKSAKKKKKTGIQQQQKMSYMLCVCYMLNERNFSKGDKNPEVVFTQNVAVIVEFE